MWNNVSLGNSTTSTATTTDEISPTANAFHSYYPYYETVQDTYIDIEEPPEIIVIFPSRLFCIPKSECPRAASLIAASSIRLEREAVHRQKYPPEPKALGRAYLMRGHRVSAAQDCM